jgi:dolichol-phosphate mannosyltransferase
MERVLVTIATYNEISNLPRLVDEVLRILPDADILVVDDNSPDGTGDWCRERSASDSKVHCMHRSGKLGLGTATVAAMRYAIESGYDLMLNLDADFSHDPQYIPDLLAAIDGVDVAVGSRYVPGGGIEGWPLRRRVMSRAVNQFVRSWLGLPLRDCSGAFRCYRVDALKRLNLDRIVATGYAFQEEVLWRLHRLGCRFAEVPIIFADRTAGKSKLDLCEVFNTLRVLLYVKYQQLRQPPRGGCDPRFEG